MRILSLHPAATELAFALGAGGSLVGRTERCAYPESALRVPPISNPEDLAMIGAFEPDLVLLGRDQDGIATMLGGQYDLFTLAPRTGIPEQNSTPHPPHVSYSGHVIERNT